MNKEIYRLERKTMFYGHKLLAETTVYAVRNDRYFLDEDGNSAVLPRKKLNKAGRFDSDFNDQTKTWYEYKVIEKVS